MLWQLDRSSCRGSNCPTKGQLIIKISISCGQVFHRQTNQCQVYILILNHLFYPTFTHHTNSSPAISQPRATNQNTRDYHLAQSPQILFRLANSIIKFWVMLSLLFLLLCDQTWCFTLHSVLQGMLSSVLWRTINNIFFFQWPWPMLPPGCPHKLKFHGYNWNIDRLQNI